MSCKRVSAFCFFLFIAGCLSGCGESKETAEPEYFLKSDRMIITKTDFAEELELKKAAYPYNIKESVPEYNEMVIDLVRVLSEEIVLLSFAKDQSIIVSKQELLEAENEIRQDYPDKSFEQMLLINAISYALWKKRLKRKLIIEKLIEKELKEKIQITSYEIIEFYDQYKAKLKKDKQTDEKIEMSESELITQLRMKKTEGHYDDWIASLAKSYPVDINKNELRACLIGLNKGSEK